MVLPSMNVPSANTTCTPAPGRGNTCRGSVAVGSVVAGSVVAGSVAVCTEAERRGQQNATSTTTVPMIWPRQEMSR